MNPEDICDFLDFLAKLKIQAAGHRQMRDDFLDEDYVADFLGNMIELGRRDER